NFTRTESGLWGRLLAVAAGVAYDQPHRIVEGPFSGGVRRGPDAIRPSRTLAMRRCLFTLGLCCLPWPVFADEPAAKGPADLIVHHGHIITLDGKSQVFEAIAVKDGRILALGEDEAVFKLGGPKTRVIDADANTVLPGLYDSHVHPLGAALSELAAPLPVLDSLKDVFAYLRKKAAE